MASRIEDYALIGDCHSAALVGRDGSIDWLCLPRFDSGACFAALLGSPRQGRWLLAPSHAPHFESARRVYRPGTLVLETRYQTPSGVARVIDFMPPRSEAIDVVRIVEGLDGTVPMTMELTIRFDYGSVVPWVRRIDRGIRATAGPETIRFTSDVELRGENFHTRADFSVRAGERIPFTLTWYSSHLAAPARRDALDGLRDTEAWWREWTGRCRYEGRWHDAVVRSLITLKALTYAPTGGICAAATTSLPEQLGGVRNWDYRYCWLRDAAFALHALMIGGYVDEARAWREWLLRAVAGKPADIQALYGLAGERRLTEFKIPWLPGYEGARPVRIGNAAFAQRQLDICGEIAGMLEFAARVGLEPSENAWRVQAAMVRFLESDWQRPDEGIWEVRGSRRHFTHSKVMAWVAVDRAVRAVRGGRAGPLDRWVSLANAIREQVLREGFDPEIGSFVQYYGAKDVDASSLLFSLVGFLPATDPRMLGTVRAVEERLVVDGLVARYRTHPWVDGLPPGEGLFLTCTFWLADNLVLQGRLDEARELFEHVLTLRNDVGLLSEQWDPSARRLTGNFPQAFSHVGLINTAWSLEKAKSADRDRKVVASG
jgi:GH15 family glucan-1,4-alpha-glucosidase